MTVGDAFKYNTLGVRVTFPHNNKVYWNLECDMIKLQKDVTTYQPFFNKIKQMEFRFDVNSETI